MPFNTAGVYTPPAGAESATPGAVIQSATWNSIFTDLSSALTQSMEQLITKPSISKNIMWANGGLEVWQRGAGASSSIAVNASTAAYTADRWYLNTGANEACTVSAQTGLTVGSNLSAKIQRNNGQTGTTAITFGYPLDTESVLQLRGFPVYVSFYAKAGANYSGGALTVNVFSGTAAPAKQTTGYTGQVTLLTGTFTPTTTTALYTFIGTVVTGATVAQAELQFVFTPTGTAGADDSFYIDDVQIEVDNSAGIYTGTLFDRIPFSICLNDCQKHYQKTYPYSIAPGTATQQNGALGLISQAALQQSIYWFMPVQSRLATPAYTTYQPNGGGTGAFYDYTASASLTATVTATAASGILIYSATAAATSHFIYVHATMDAGI